MEKNVLEHKCADSWMCESLTFVSHCNCRERRAGIWYCTLLFGRLARETGEKSEEVRSLKSIETTTGPASVTGLLFTFIFTLAQAGRLSLQLLWTDELQSGRREGKKSR